jgi:hypothetical protein
MDAGIARHQNRPLKRPPFWRARRLAHAALLDRPARSLALRPGVVETAPQEESQRYAGDNAYSYHDPPPFDPLGIVLVF